MYWSTGVFIEQWALLPEKAEQIMLHELTSSLKYQLSTDGFVKHKRTSTYSIVLQYISQNDWNSFQYSQWRKVIKSICVWPLFLYSFPDLWVCWVWVSSLSKSLTCFHSELNTKVSCDHCTSYFIFTHVCLCDAKSSTETIRWKQTLASRVSSQVGPGSNRFQRCCYKSCRQQPAAVKGVTLVSTLYIYTHTFSSV